VSRACLTTPSLLASAQRRLGYLEETMSQRREHFSMDVKGDCGEVAARITDWQDSRTEGLLSTSAINALVNS
jgi:hypothetical protein